MGARPLCAAETGLRCRLLENIAMSTITTAIPMMTYCWERRDTTPSGFLVRSETCAIVGCCSGNCADAVAMIRSWLLLPLEGQVFLADFEVSLIHYLWQDIGSVFELEFDEVRLVVLHLVDRELLSSV